MGGLTNVIAWMHAVKWLTLKRIFLSVGCATIHPGVILAEGSYLDLVDLLGQPEPKAVSIGVPSGFGAAKGLMFASVAFTDQDPNTGIQDDVDGSISIGVGLGDPRTGIATEIVIGVTSVSTSLWGDGTFGDEGNIGIKFHRQILGLPSARIASMAFGVGNLAGWGGTKDLPRNIYAAYSQISDVNIGQNFFPVNTTFGLGSAVANVDRDAGFFASMGIGITPDVSAGVSWLGDEVQVGAVYFPRFLSGVSTAFTYADVTHLNSDSGRMILSLSYAFDWWSK